ncbi:transcription antitermination factor NusB [Wohlfahrtiimonas chitiniclastica]|uniref:transcription antitermination factor NusB n=1 Tax=Wohlfahrtiimonas chitiniclastica TaxID=400946 RepID=UPI001BCC8D04|nr:transcription antitermination factor NusB [Wohlfahrtiimonas chitiniclastica]MBS7818198.1 transcription antitermination factor NusB [Wohlfahrtiimonas chitiniclastica]MBS7826052.1 transcription antitermination factor NusB [Wohlfahrtiimonas chitiniclastica]
MSNKREFERMMWARRFALQGLYEWQVSQTQVDQIERSFAENPEFVKANTEAFSNLLRGSIRTQGQVNELITPLLDRPIEQLDLVERAVLWLGGFELLEHPEMPYKVVINESVNLAKKFGANQSYKFINGILDKVAEKVRIDYH